MSFVPARISTRATGGSRIPSIADRRPNVVSHRRSAMAEAVHPGRPLHRTTATVVVASGGEAASADDRAVVARRRRRSFSSRSKCGP